MHQTRDHLESLERIRSIMERSTTVLSLSGLSGVIAGVCALAGVSLAVGILDGLLLRSEVVDSVASDPGLQLAIFRIAAAALVISLASAIFLTIRRARRLGYPIWDGVSRQFVFSTGVPLIVGGLFMIALVMAGAFSLLCGASLVFFGLATISGGRYTRPGMLALGTIEAVLGVVAAFWWQGGLILWALGFGVAPIVYGITMYLKYEA